MDFALTEQQTAIQDSVARLCSRFDDGYWLGLDRDARFPEEFYRAFADAGWLGIAMPAEHGGAGLGVTEAVIMMAEVARAGGMSASSALHINIFGPHAIVVHGTNEQKARWLPDLIGGKIKACFGVTEANAGLNTTHIQTRAERRPGGYLINGRKIWTSTAQEASKILLLARTTPLEECRRQTEGMTLFYTDLDRSRIDVRRIAKMGRAAVDSNELFIEDLEVAEEDRIGEEGRGFEYILHSLNPERCLIAAEAIGTARQALDRASRYAREREVFGRPIGMNQAIQHPLAENWVELEAAWTLCLKAAWLYDTGQQAGVYANAAKYFAAEAGFKTCTQAVMTHGGMGYAKEFHVERLLREILICRLAPISPQLALCHIAEKALDLPKSY